MPYALFMAKVQLLYMYGKCMPSLDIAKILTFLRHAENLKNTLRSATTSQGRAESSAEHSWRVALMVLLSRQVYPEANVEKMLSMALVHDLAEAICGDTPAPQIQNKDHKHHVERQGMLALCKALPEALCDELLAVWDEYEEGRSVEAQWVKAFDKLETMLQHSQGRNGEDFDYAFSLSYGREYTDVHPFLQEIRAQIDKETQKRMHV